MKPFRYLTCVGLILLVGISRSLAVVHIDGTADQRAKIASWLTRSLGTTVGIDAGGNLTIAAGGNPAATRLRNMINDAATSVTLHIVSGDATIYGGAWNSSITDPKGPTTGIQEIDIADLETAGNLLASYGYTPDVRLMHEITEVYEGKKNGYYYEVAHALAIAAEIEVITANGCTWVFRPEDQQIGNMAYGKIKRPDGSYVVIRVDFSDPTHKLKWFTEQVACKFESSKLIAIADPDPKVHLFTYEYDLTHTYSSALDTVNSHPTGVAFDAAHNLYICENQPSGQDEVRVVSPAGTPISTITNSQLVDPEGIDIDKVTGEIFVAVQGRVLRFGSSGTLIGSYSTSSPSFRPTDVAVWRNLPTEELRGDGSIYDILVTDRTTSQVYRFDVQGNLNTGTFAAAFGSGMLASPEGLQVDDVWTVWVASTGNHRVYRFTPFGAVEPLGAQPFFLEDLSKQIFDIAKVREDGLYVVDETPGQGKLLLYDLDANLTHSYGAGTLQCPSSVAFDFSADLGNLIPISDPDSILGIPALSDWGLVVFAGLLLIGGMILIRRRALATT